MKYKKILRLLGIITVLSLLLAVIPATPALATVTLILNPTSGKVGDRINYSGTGYGINTGTSDYYIDVYLSNQSATVGGSMGVTITQYVKLVWGLSLNDDGSFSGYFNVAANMTDISGIMPPLPITAGTTYYVYTTIRYNDSAAATPPATIASVASFTAAASAGLNALSATSGAAGSSVTVSGSGFLPSYPVLINFDTTLVSSTTFTDTSGSFTGTITIPSSATAGAHTISATVGATVLTATFTVIASAALNALVPATGAPGSSVTVSGSNFAPSYPVIISFDTTVVSSTTITNTSGTFSGTVTVPSNALAGAHKVNVTVGTVIVSADFTVTAAATPTTTPPTTTPPTTTPPATSKAILSINQSGHTVGATIGIGGAGFTPGATATIKYDDTQVATVKVEANGTFISPFFKAVGIHGDHTVTASDGTNTAKTTFTMESTPPKVPPPLLPELGAKAKSPATFDWTDVTDDSMPVTYRLQVSTDKSFGTTSLLLDKTGITTSGYTLTATEEAQLTGTDTPYYWRVEAIDAASNESGWTGASIFYISGPFKLPSWGIYAGAAAGALIFFLIGLWVGRRTAFYY